MATNNKKTTSKKEPTKADLEAQIAALKAQLEQQKEQQKTKEVADSVTTTSIPTAPITFTIPSTDVTVVYCSDSLGYAKISNMELHFNRYGEEFILSRSQFDELVGKYRGWFDRGVLAVSSKNVDIAAAKGLKTDKELGLDAQTLKSLGNMSCSQLENLWNSLTTSSQQESVILFYKRKFIEGDSAFTNREKIDLLNRLTNGGFTREQDELSGRYKIYPTEM